jgi:hypothetical protein
MTVLRGDWSLFQIIAQSNTRFNSRTPALAGGRGFEVEAEVVLLGEADERPVVEEAAVVDVAEVVEDHPTGRAEAGRESGRASRAQVIGQSRE